MKEVKLHGLHILEILSVPLVSGMCGFFKVSEITGPFYENSNKELLIVSHNSGQKK